MLNSEILLASKPCINATNRGLIYGDSFSFVLRGNSSKVFLLDKYFNYMISTMKLYKMEIPGLLKKMIFQTDIELLLQKNRIYKGFSANVTVYRNESEGSIAQDNSVSILIVVKSLITEKFTLNTKGANLNICKDFIYPKFLIENSRLPIFNEGLLMHKKMQGNDKDALISCDEEGFLICSTDSLLLFSRNGNLVLPKKILDNSNKVFLDYLVFIAKSLKIVVEVEEIKQKDLLSFDEVLLVNSEYGIKWVLAYKEKRYYNRMASFLVNAANRSIE